MIKYILIAIGFCIQGYGQDIEWEKSFGGKHTEYLSEILATPDYGFILAGSSASGKNGNKTEINEGDLDYWIAKMDEKGSLEWQKNFGSKGKDFLKMMKATKDGGYILGGNSSSSKSELKKSDCNGKDDLWIVKLNAAGGITWEKTIGGFNQENLGDILPTSDGYLIGGSSNSPISGNKTESCKGNSDYWIVKLDSKGEIAWQKTYGGSRVDILKVICQTTDGGAIIAGSSNSPMSGDKTEGGYGFQDFWLIRIDKSGEIIWQRTIGAEGDDDLSCMIRLRDGNYIVAGTSNSGSNALKSTSGKDTDFWIFKMNEMGEILWQKNYDYGKVDILVSVEENNDGTIVVGGYAQSEVMGTAKKDKKGINDYIILKIDSSGEEIWSRTVGSEGDDVLTKAIETRDGSYILAGTSEGKISRDRNNKMGKNDFWIVKLNDKEKKKVEKVLIEAFPNPTSHFTNIVIGYDFERGTCTVFDLSGRQLDSFEINSRTVPVDLGGYPVGVYIVEIATNIQRDGIKVIKKD